MKEKNVKCPLCGDTVPESEIKSKPLMDTVVFSCAVCRDEISQDITGTLNIIKAGGIALRRLNYGRE